MAALPALAAPGMGPVLLEPIAVDAGQAPSPYVPHLAATIVSPSPVVAVADPQHDESRPILPPRPTGRMQTEPSRSIWRNWPVFVIVIALLAIAAAVVLMLWPPAASAKAGSTKLPPPPAPERMDTNPMAPRDPGAAIPPQRGGDPWSNRGGITPPPVNPPDDPDATIDPDDLLKDPFANPRGGGGGVLGGNPFGGMGGTGGALVFAMVSRACDRMKQCPSSAAVDMCTVIEQSLGQFPMPPPPASCVAAQRCLSQIDRIDLCGSSSGNGLAEITMLMSTAQDCIDAARC